MNVIVYDGSFAGWLTAVFEVYEYKFSDPQIITSGSIIPLLGTHHQVHTSDEKAERVLKKLRLVLSAKVCKKLYEAHHSDTAETPNVMFRFLGYGLKYGQPGCTDYSNEAVLTLHQILRKVHRERHRMEAFARFQRSTDDVYFATVEPDFDVLPLISRHFASRYADQRWLIFDKKRKYGILYDLNHVHFVTPVPKSVADMAPSPSIGLHEDEQHFQELWQHYFQSVNIGERKNMTLHIRHMPKRYWKYLSEKQ